MVLFLVHISASRRRLLQKEGERRLPLSGLQAHLIAGQMGQQDPLAVLPRRRVVQGQPLLSWGQRKRQIDLLPTGQGQDLPSAWPIPFRRRVVSYTVPACCRAACSPWALARRLSWPC